jgi:hypothetical protein
MPDVDKSIVVPHNIVSEQVESNFDNIYPFDLTKEPHEHWFLNFTRHMSIAVKKLYGDGVKQAVYMDTDTYVCAPVSELFNIVDAGMAQPYAIAGVHAPGRSTGVTVKPIPAIFPEINIGVNPMNTAKVIPMWEEVYNWYAEHANVYKNNDQSPLREFLWSHPWNYPLYIMPPEYNLRLFGGFIRGKVKIFHGRTGESTHEEIIKKINKTERMRIWLKGRILEL